MRTRSVYPLQSPSSKTGSPAFPVLAPGCFSANPALFHIKNNVELIGFLGKDAQVRTANSNDNEFTVLSIATQESWKDKETGEWQRATEWHSVICNNALGKYAAGLTKGTHLLVEGVLRRGTYTIQSGSGKKREDKQIRSWFIKAISILKLDRPGKGAEDSESLETESAEAHESDF